MKILFIGGTGNISTACSRLALARGMELFVLNRGKRENNLPAGARSLVADMTDPASVKAALGGLSFDSVVNFIAFTPADIERDLALFRGLASQYIFISSASAYQKPCFHPVVDESTPLKNPYWEYSRNKIHSENRLWQAYREEDFPAVIVRPSLTYDSVFPVAIGGWSDFTFINRIRRGGEMIIHGDGTSLWTITHSDDFALGLVGLLGQPASIGHAFHITSDEILTWDAIYQTVAEAAGVPAARRVHIPSHFLAAMDSFQRGNLLGDKAHSVIFDNTKIKRFVPGFKAVVTFSEGIRRTLAWFEEREDRRRVVPAIDTAMDQWIAAWRKACQSGLGQEID